MMFSRAVHGDTPSPLLSIVPSILIMRSFDGTVPSLRVVFIAPSSKSRNGSIVEEIVIRKSPVYP